MRLDEYSIAIFCVVIKVINYITENVINTGEINGLVQNREAEEVDPHGTVSVVEAGFQKSRDFRNLVFFF